MDNIKIYDVGFVLAASKRKSYQEDTIKTFDVYIKFLQENGLTTRTILDSDQRPDSKTQIMSSDLTQEGIEFIKKAEQKWWSALDRGTSPEDVTILNRELAKLRNIKS